MSFLQEYDALNVQAIGPQEVAKQQVALIQEWVVQKPGQLFKELRQNRPIFDTPAAVVVSRYRDVLEVIDFDEIFSVYPYGVAMKRNNGGPNFILGMDRSPEYTHDRSALNLAIKREDLGLIRQIVAEEAAKETAAARPAGKLDITDGFARYVPALLAGRYFGVPGPSPQQLMSWCRAVFTDLFLNFTQDPEIQEAGMTAGQQYRDYIDGLVAERHSARARGEAPKDDVIGRLVTMQCAPNAAFTDSRVRDNLIGCITGILDNTNTAVVNIMTVLFEHADALAGAVAAAKAGDNDTVLAYIYEALRFHPPAPLVVRLALSDHVLAKGTDRESTIPAKKIVFAANGSAMMDETLIDNPEEFRIHRPYHNYLHFGWGLHECLGKYLAQVQLTELVKSLLVLPGIRRAAGDAGQVKYAGPFPTGFSVEFDVS